VVFYDQAGNAHWLQHQRGSGDTFVSPGQDVVFTPAEEAGETSDSSGVAASCQALNGA